MQPIWSNNAFYKELAFLKTTVWQRVCGKAFGRFWWLLSLCMAWASPGTTGGWGSFPRLIMLVMGSLSTENTHAGTALPSSVVRTRSLWRMCSDSRMPPQWSKRDLKLQGKPCWVKSLVLFLFEVLMTDQKSSWKGWGKLRTHTAGLKVHKPKLLTAADKNQDHIWFWPALAERNVKVVISGKASSLFFLIFL